MGARLPKPTTQVYRKTGNLSAVKLRLGHAKVDRKVRDLGVDLEYAQTAAKGHDIRPNLAIGSLVRYLKAALYFFMPR